MGTLLYGGNENSAFKQLRNAFRTMATLEPDREGPLHDYLRGMSVIKHNPSPSVQFVEPLDGEEFHGYLAVEIFDWSVDPSKAVSAATQFANGHQESGTGHTHVWFFKMENGGAQPEFFGANGLTPVDGDETLHVSKMFCFDEPGEYKAFVQLQNHDHTAAIPATAKSFPGIDSVTSLVSVDSPYIVSNEANGCPPG